MIDADGLVLCAGFFDMHVHLRDPGQTYKEDIVSGTSAAAAGGVTSLLAMPNTVPTTDCSEVVSDIISRSKNCKSRVYVCAAISKGLDGEVMTDFSEIKSAGAIALSDDGKPVKTSRMTEDALRCADSLNMLVTAHCEDLKLAGKGIINKGEVSDKLGVEGISNASEYMAVKREVGLARKLGVHVHIAHVSTDESIEIIRKAKAEGIKVTCETAPHYFVFTDKELLAQNADFRMNPPLRSEKDRLSVIAGLKDGTIDCIVTDHAPHSEEEKSDFHKAPNGAIGMETTFSAAYTYLVKNGIMTLPDMLFKMSGAQADILNIESGRIKEGYPADLVLLDLDEEWTVDRNKLHGKSKNTPFHGIKLCGRVKRTILDGETVFIN